MSCAQPVHADLRHETLVRITGEYESRVLRSVARQETSGFVLRVMCGGGLGVVTFSRREDFPWALETALQDAKLLQNLSPVSFAPVPVTRGAFEPRLDEDPRCIPLEEKLALVREYSEAALACPGIVRTLGRYREEIRVRTFASTEGTSIAETLCNCNASLWMTAADGSRQQSTCATVGGSSGLRNLRGRWQVFEPRCRSAVELLKAPLLEGGNYRCIFAPRMTGIFVHEAFGHLMEADLFAGKTREKIRRGAELGSELLSITADSTRPGGLGFYRFDDEGVPVRRVELMKNGILTGFLHSRETAAAFGDEPTGHAIAQDHGFAPLVRMGAIFVEPGTHTPEALLEGLGEGLYVEVGGAGNSMGEEFTFSGAEIHRVRGGKKVGMVQPTNFLGNLNRTLRSVEAVGNDFWLSEAGVCGKWGQTNFRSAMGGASLLLSGVTAGG